MKHNSLEYESDKTEELAKVAFETLDKTCKDL